jgi:hypothetical protein
LSIQSKSRAQFGTSFARLLAFARLAVTWGCKLTVICYARLPHSCRRIAMVTQRPLTANWMEVLANVERVLAEAVTEIDQRDAALAAVLAAPGAPVFGFDLQADKTAGARARAEERVAELDTALKDCEDALRQWLVRAEATRRKLATWAERA